MSYTVYEPSVSRLQRCDLTVPGSSPKMFEKALNSDADFVFLDLEDSVATPDKIQARANVIDGVNNLDWKGANKTICVRINGLETGYWLDDVIQLVEHCGEKLDTILIPKVGVYDDIYMVECIVNTLEIKHNRSYRKGSVRLECLIETALGMSNVDEIARKSVGSRLESMHFGVADYAASTRARTTNIGGLNENYPGDQWHSALSRMVVACRAYGLRPVDGPYGDIKDKEGYVLAAKRAAALGCTGKWAIHPSQIPLANEVFTPSKEEVATAERILDALYEASKAGQGAASLDGKMIDVASEKMAKNILETINIINSRARGGKYV
jgi:citrate lyase subunit beta/citryl-CoA lyase